MLPRVLETEAMDTLAEARDYDTMDHDEVNTRFVTELAAAAQLGGTVLDLGTGTARIPIELCRRFPDTRVTAVDLARWMLLVARENVTAADLEDRIELVQLDAKRLPFNDAFFDMVISNSIVHHIPEPSVALAEAWRVLRPEGLIFIRDLYRPTDAATVDHLVTTHAAAANAEQRRMFSDSFRAALSLAEIRELVVDLGANPEGVRMTSDRHWTWITHKR